MAEAPSFSASATTVTTNPTITITSLASSCSSTTAHKKNTTMTTTSTSTATTMASETTTHNACSSHWRRTTSSITTTSPYFSSSSSSTAIKCPNFSNNSKNNRKIEKSDTIMMNSTTDTDTTTTRIAKPTTTTINNNKRRRWNSINEKSHTTSTSSSSSSPHFRQAPSSTVGSLSTLGSIFYTWTILPPPSLCIRSCYPSNSNKSTTTSDDDDDDDVYPWNKDDSDSTSIPSSFSSSLPSQQTTTTSTTRRKTVTSCYPYDDINNNKEKKNPLQCCKDCTTTTMGVNTSTHHSHHHNHDRAKTINQIGCCSSSSLLSSSNNNNIIAAVACKFCQVVIQDAIRHFSNCIQFQESFTREFHLAMMTATTTTIPPPTTTTIDHPNQHHHQHHHHRFMCVEIAEQVIVKKKNCIVRHLCPNGCYLKAFTPTRDWIQLRKIIHYQTDLKLDDVLHGWRIVLTDPPGLRGVVFQNKKKMTQEQQRQLQQQRELDFDYKLQEEESTLVGSNTTDNTVNKDMVEEEEEESAGKPAIVETTETARGTGSREDTHHHLPRTVYISFPDGKHYTNQAQVCRAILDMTQSESPNGTTRYHRLDDTTSEMGEVPSNSVRFIERQSRRHRRRLCFASPPSLVHKPLKLQQRIDPLQQHGLAEKPPKVAATIISKYGRQENGEYSSSPSCCDSPLGLLEELYCHNPWQLLISTIFLNRTRRIQVDRVLYEFFQQWPTAQDIVNLTTTSTPTTTMVGTTERPPSSNDDRKSAATTATRTRNLQDVEGDEWGVKQIYSVIQPLGLGPRRARGIIQFTKDYLKLVESKKNSHLLSQYQDSNHEVCQVQSMKNAPSPSTTTTTSSSLIPRHIEFTLSNKEIQSFYQCGKYAADAYQIFIRREWDNTCNPTDHALQAYVEWRRGLHT